MLIKKRFRSGNFVLPHETHDVAHATNDHPQRFFPNHKANKCRDPTHGFFGECDIVRTTKQLPPCICS